MWYFTWLLGLGLACAFAIINAMWYEAHASGSVVANVDPAAGP